MGKPDEPRDTVSEEYLNGMRRSAEIADLRDTYEGMIIARLIRAEIDAMKPDDDEPWMHERRGGFGDYC